MACGAAISAYRWLETNEWDAKTDKTANVQVPPGTDSFDFQYAYIREALKPYFEEIKAAEEPMVELGYAMYDVTRRYIEHIVEPIPNVKISMIGGIQINVHKPCGDLFAPLMFEVREKGKPTKDLLHTFTEIQQYD